MVRAPTGDISTFTTAYDRRLSEIEAVPNNRLAALNIDARAAVATVLGALPGIAAFRPQLEALPEVDQHLIAGLSDYASAAGEANARYLVATSTPTTENIPEMYDRALKTRETLRSDMRALANRGLIDRARLASLRHFTGYKNVAFDLIDYATLMSESWRDVEGKTALSEGELLMAKRLGENILTAVGEFEHGPLVIARTARIRRQAFTLLLNAYDETRRAIAFLRGHRGDANAITPSLYPKRIVSNVGTTHTHQL